MILFHRTAAAPWGHVVSIIKRSSTGDSLSFGSTPTTERVNFVLNPQKTCPDAFSECLNERTQDARYAKKKKKKNQIQITGTTEEYDYLFWTIIKIAILMAFTSGGNV